MSTSLFEAKIEQINRQREWTVAGQPVFFSVKKLLMTAGYNYWLNNAHSPVCVAVTAAACLFP